MRKIRRETGIADEQNGTRSNIEPPIVRLRKFLDSCPRMAARYLIVIGDYVVNILRMLDLQRLQR